MVLHLLSCFYFFFHRSTELMVELSLGLTSGSPLTVHFLFDLYSVLFLSFIYLISSVVVFYRIFYMRGDLTQVRFLILVLLFVLSINFLVVSPSLLGLIFGWDGLGVTSFLLVVYYNNVSSLRSGLLTVYTNRLGDIFLFFSFFLVFSLGWTGFDFFYWFDYYVFFLFLLLSGMTKSAQLPFSSWLPAAIAAPTPVSSLVHSSTLVTAGVYLFVRFFFLFDGLIFLRLFGLLFLLTSFSAGLFACYEVDLKRLVAMSTLSQLGLIICCIRVAHVFFSFFHMISHALFKSLLFLSCGAIILLGLGLQDMRFKGRKVYSSLVLIILLLTANLSLCGLPFLRGFFSKDLIIETFISISIGSRWVWVFIFCASCILSIVYSFRLVALSLINNNFYFGGFMSSFCWARGLCMVILGFWAVSLGGLFSSFFLDGEYSLLHFFDRVIGCLFFVVLPAYFIIAFVCRGFFREILWFNWVRGGLFTFNYRQLIGPLLGEQLWAELLLPKGYTSLVFYSSRLFLFHSSALKVVVLVFFFCTALLLLLPFSLLKCWFEESERVGKQNVFLFSFCLP